jgi:hypothetical protein
MQEMINERQASFDNVAKLMSDINLIAKDLVQETRQ